MRAAGPNYILRSASADVTNYPAESDLLTRTQSADLFPRVKHLVQQLFIPHKLKALLLNTYFHQAESINLI